MKREPFILLPAAKDYLWGGTRLNDDYNFNQSVSPFAEAWVCSTHRDGSSLVASGEELKAVLKDNPEWLGTHPLQIMQGNAELPILIKLIDVKKRLSVQVHPDDEYAMQYEHSLGKTEMWYILDAKPDSFLFYGFNQQVTADQVKKSIHNGSIESLLNRVSVHKNDLFYIEAGTVHSVGPGVLVAEIQESSNLTYRLYDFDRIDKNGKKRPLHIEKALEVADFRAKTAPRQPLRVLKYRNGCASELLTRCKYFQVERLLLNTEVHRSLMEFKTDENSFHALLCIDGCGNISWNDGAINFFKGDCVFVPADSEIMKIHGKAHMLNISC